MSEAPLSKPHDYPSAPLGRAETLFAEMIRVIQEEGPEDPSAFNSAIKDEGLGFCGTTFGMGDVQVDICGRQADRKYRALGDEGQDRLVQRGWILPEQDGGVDYAPTYLCEGITSRADRRHLARELLSVAIEIYDIPKERRIYFQIRH